MPKNTKNNNCKNRSYRLFYSNGNSTIYRTSPKKIAAIFDKDDSIVNYQEEIKV